MRLRALVSPIRLRLGVLSKRLTTATLGVRLRTVALSKRLVVAVGDFIKAIYPVDTVTATDNLSRATTKPLSDSAIATEAIGIIPNKRPTDIVGLFDDQLYFEEDYVIGAPIAQTYTLNKQVELVVSKPISDAVSAIDAKAFSLQRSFFESLNVTDDINGVLADDDQTIELIKPVTNQVTALDTNYVAAMAKILADVPLATSSGSLYSQGYTVDMSYFDEDYVGESRAFS